MSCIQLIGFWIIFLEGGGSDIRTISADLSSRLFVAGGGGGGGSANVGAYGGAGALVGEDAYNTPGYGGSGGTASAGGIGGNAAAAAPNPGAGSLGIGGTAGYTGGRV